MKKDEFRLNDKVVSSTEISNLLESAGFSSSNPYYIVEQGKVSLLSTMKDNERLELLKEVAGTRVFDEKKNESLKILQQQDSKKVSIDETIDYVKERLSELKVEEKELNSFKKYDSERRIIEYTIYNKQLQEAIQNIEKIDNDRNAAFGKSSIINEQTQDLQERIRQDERSLSDAKNKLITKKKQKETEEEEKKLLEREIHQTKLEIEDMSQLQRSDKQNKEATEPELRALELEIQTTETELKRLEEEFSSFHLQETKVKEALNENRRRQNELFAKSGRKDQFNSKEDRDIYLKKEIQKRTDQINETTDKIEKLKENLITLEKQKSANEKETKNLEKQISDSKKESNKLQNQLQNYKELRDSKINERKITWRKKQENSTEIQQLTEVYEKQKKYLESTRSSEITKGIESVEELVRQRKISGYYGPVINLIKVSSRYHLAVEATAGNSLFHIVVENSDVARQIIDTMNNSDKPGRVTFIPLEQINPRIERLDLPETEAIPLLSKIETQYPKVAQELFGSTFVAKAIDNAAHVSKTYRVNCVTLDGDKVDKKGTLQGGYIEAKRVGRLKAQANLQNANENRQYALEEKDRIEALITNLDNEITNLSSEITSLELQIRSIQNNTEAATQKLITLKTNQVEIQESLTRFSSTLNSMESNLSIWEKDCEKLQQELASNFDSRLSKDEEIELANLVTSIVQLSEEAEQLEQKAVESEAKLDSNRFKLRSNLIPRRQDLLIAMQSTYSIDDTPHTSESLVENQKKLQQLEKDLVECDNRIYILDQNIEEVNNLIKSKEEAIEREKIQLEDKLNILQERDTTLEKLLNERKILIEKREESIRAIRELGSIPQDHDRVSSLSGKELLDHLHNVKEKLKKYQHVNKKAIDQLEEFKEKLKEFTKKKKELDDEENAIRDLVKVLDRRKHEVFTRTFKQVSTHFSEIFSRIVPGGSAELIIHENKNEENGNSRSKNEIDRYGGVSIRTNFIGSGEEQLMQQLSGGQKTVVALSLIFAIQKCDPAPFYLLDEIDSALDPTYRKAIAELIQQQSENENIQFIVTTFKTELVHIANQHFGIKFQNKVSQISPISKNKALSILAEEERQIEED